VILSKKEVLKMKIIEVKTSDLLPYANNPRHNDNAVEAVASSIKEFGFKVPIIIDKDNIIVAGHTRLKAAQKLGLQAVPCIVADDLSPEQIKAFRIADNKTAELSEWDFEKLESELQELADLDVEMAQFGFDDLLEHEPTEIVEDEVPEIDEENLPTTKVYESLLDTILDKNIPCKIIFCLETRF
jgi:site-specific DNA-methyltransferase (adenine-specific)